VIGVDEVTDESDHLAGGDAPAFFISIGFEINHAGKSLAVLGPAATVSDEILSLGGSGALAWVGKVVGASDESLFVGTVILLGKVWAFIVCALRCLYFLLVAERGRLKI
jgi:hypothetical protein